MNRLPDWFKQKIPTAESLETTRKLLGAGVNTVCVEAKCPNSARCFQDRKLTFLILGSTCTRSCRFCAVRKSKNWPLHLDEDEPEKIAQTVRNLEITYAVITSVSRDDLADGGAGHFSRTIRAIRRQCPGVFIEVLIPDFRGNTCSLEILAKAGADVIGHNLETVSRLYRRLRPEADYSRSLKVLSGLKQLNNAAITKSSLILGLSETSGELINALKDLRQARCDILTLGQYLAPSANHEPVKQFISPEEFSKYKDLGYSLGFKSVLSGPLVRSSFRAEEAYREVYSYGYV